MLKAFFSKQFSWARSLQGASVIAASADFSQAYFTNEAEKDQHQGSENAYHEQESEDILLESSQEHESRSAMINSYFNEHSELRYGLASYICDHCSRFYSFGNVDELREHVLEYHEVDTRFNTAKMQIRDVNHRQHAEKHVYNYVSSTSFGYTTVEIEVFDLNLSLCIDFGGAVSLLNRAVLLKGNLYGIVHSALSITIIDVSRRQIASQVAKIEVELSFSKISLKMTTYLVKNLFSELIIVNDVLNRLDVNLQHGKNIIKIESQEVLLFYSNADFSNVSYHYAVISVRLGQHSSEDSKR